MSLNDTQIFSKKKHANNKSSPSNVKSNSEFCTFFSLDQLTKVKTRMTCNRATTLNHILVSYSVRVTQKGIDAGLSDHQHISCTRKFLRLKDTDMLNSASSSITWLIFLRKL